MSYSFLKAVEDEMSYETNPLYAIAHETIYCSGAGAVGSNSSHFALPARLHRCIFSFPDALAQSKWSAQRIMQERKDFDYKEKLRDPKGKVG